MLLTLGLPIVKQEAEEEEEDWKCDNIYHLYTFI